MTETVIKTGRVYEYDVVVTGAGPAGIVAAVAAARAGHKTCLLEQTAVAGGMGTSGLVNVIAPYGDGERSYLGGLGREIIERLVAAGGITDYADDGPYDPRTRRFVPFYGETLKRVYDQLLTDSGVDLTLLCKVSAAARDGGRLDSLTAFDADGPALYKAAVFIDTTGDAVLAALSGAKFLTDGAGELQAPTMMSLYTGIDFDRYYEALGNGTIIEQAAQLAFERGDLPYIERHIPGVMRLDKTGAVVNIGHVYGAECVSAQGLTAATLKGRELAGLFHAFYQKYIPGFEQAVLMQTGSLLGVRETRRVRGVQVLTAADFVEKRVFENRIGISNYPIDVHAARDDKAAFDSFYSDYSETYTYKTGEYFSIPLGCLVADGLQNLLVGGRCISADRKMQGSVRVMPTCWITGEAAGTAALCAGGTLDYKAVQAALIKNGAVLD